MLARWSSRLCNIVRAKAQSAIEGSGGSKLECARNLDAASYDSLVPINHQNDISRGRTIDKNIRFILRDYQNF